MEGMRAAESTLHLKQEQAISWSNDSWKYAGVADYIIGPDASASNLIVAEAKKGWHFEDKFQLIGQLGCLLRSRMDAGKNTPVFGLLTNGERFKFIAIDTDLVVRSTYTISLTWSSQHVHEKSENGLKEILTMIKWIVSSTSRISPTCSAVHLKTRNISKSLRSMRSCFGVKG